jgi:CRISPR/Cas system-associated exonuclease Cas4 (RecB family)
VPQQGFHCIVDFEDVSFEACVECATTLGRCQLTASLLRGMADQARARNADDDVRARAAAPIPVLSVTALTGCVRQAYLKATEPYHQRPDQQYWSYRGTLGHLLAERGAGPDTIAERRFERELQLPSGRLVTITGKPDEIDPGRGLLIDYKTTDRAPRQASPLHIAQLNAYRWLVAPAYEINRLGIVYLTMKGVQKASMPIWPDGQVERFLQERAGALAEAYAGGDWPALTEDRWMCNYCPVTAACERGLTSLAAS